MKEIKFRYVFKHKDFKDVSLYHFTLEEIEKGALTKVLNSGMIENGYEFISKDQYIGLKDKNGKEIYAKDILENLKSHIRAEVKWSNIHVGFIAEAQVDDGYVCPILGGEDILIIGNVFEDPELLKIK